MFVVDIKDSCLRTNAEELRRQLSYKYDKLN